MCRGRRKYPRRWPAYRGPALLSRGPYRRNDKAQHELSTTFRRRRPDRVLNDPFSAMVGDLVSLLEALLAPADRRFKSLLARDLAKLLALWRVRHRRHAEHFLPILDIGH